MAQRDPAVPLAAASGRATRHRRDRLRSQVLHLLSLGRLQRAGPDDDGESDPDAQRCPAAA